MFLLGLRGLLFELAGGQWSSAVLLLLGRRSFGGLGAFLGFLGRVVCLLGLLGELLARRSRGNDHGLGRRADLLDGRLRKCSFDVVLRLRCACLWSLRGALRDFLRRFLAGFAESCGEIDVTLLVTSVGSSQALPSDLVEIVVYSIGGVGCQVIRIELLGIHILLRLFLLLLGFVFLLVFLMVMMVMLLLAVRPVQAFVWRRPSKV